MPVHINEVEADVQVDSSTPIDPVAPQDPQALFEQWLEQQRRAQQQAARTAAFGFDD